MQDDSIHVGINDGEGAEGAYRLGPEAGECSAYFAAQQIALRNSGARASKAAPGLTRSQRTAALISIVAESATAAAGAHAGILHDALVLAELEAEASFGIGVGFGPRIAVANAFDYNRVSRRRAAIQHPFAGNEDRPLLIRKTVVLVVRVVRIVRVRYR